MTRRLHPRRAVRSLADSRARADARILAFCHVGAGRALGAPQGEAGTHVAGVKVSDSRAIVAEVRVDAIGIEQTMSEQLEHGASQCGGDWLTHHAQQVAGR